MHRLKELQGYHTLLATTARTDHCCVGDLIWQDSLQKFNPQAPQCSSATWHVEFALVTAVGRWSHEVKDLLPLLLQELKFLRHPTFSACAVERAVGDVAGHHLPELCTFTGTDHRIIVV